MAYGNYIAFIIVDDANIFGAAKRIYDYTTVVGVEKLIAVCSIINTGRSVIEKAGK